MNNQYRPMDVPPPGETLDELLRERGLSQAELAQRTGRTPKHINEIIKKGAPITPETALQLERALLRGPSAGFWNRLEALYRESIAEAKERERLEQEEYEEWAREFPINEMVRHGWIERSSPRDWADKAEKLLRFFGVVSPDAWRDLWGGQRIEVAFRRNESFANEAASVAAWLRQGERLAAEIRTEPYDAELFNDHLLRIRTATCLDPADAEETMIDLCRQSGVAVVRLPKVGRAPVSGATRWLRPDKAMILLSGRGKKEDIFWFTFFHEAAHILLHGKREVFLDTNDGKADEAEEKEADAFAANLLIPPSEWQEFLAPGGHFSKDRVLRFARDLEICPAIVVGRLQREKLMAAKNLNELKRPMPE